MHSSAASIASHLSAAHIASVTYDARLSDAGLNYRIDEIALMVDSTSQLGKLTDQLQRLHGWSRFNQARDAVVTGPIRSKYEVEYTFFKHPERNYRLEVMRLMRGVSPLHMAFDTVLDSAGCVLVHASFKCEDEETYAYSRQHMQEMGYLEAQRCESTYGRFGYWTTANPVPQAVPYLKPRVNLRDAA